MDKTTLGSAACAGFSFIEVLISTFIVVSGVLGLTSAHLVSNTLAYEAMLKTQASQALQQWLALIKIHEPQFLDDKRRINLFFKVDEILESCPEQSLPSGQSTSSSADLKEQIKRTLCQYSLNSSFSFQLSSLESEGNLSNLYKAQVSWRSDMTLAKRSHATDPCNDSYQSDCVKAVISISK